MNDEKLQAPNWNVWRNKREARIWEAVALSLNIEPSAIPRRGAQQRPAYGCIDDFADRLDVAVSRASELGPIPMSARGYFWDSRIALAEFADLADECAWSLDSNFPRSTPAGPALAVKAHPVEPQALPVATAGASGSEVWIDKARDRAVEIINRQHAKDLYPSQEIIADEIAKEFRAADLVGADGKPLSGATIKRHALKGISSAIGKQLATTIRRGK